MQNPFVYGEIVPAGAFANRVLELDRLVRDLDAAQKVFLISPRRYGKSSLIRRALVTMARRGAVTVEVTVSSFSSYVAFLEGYARAIVAAETARDRARAWLSDVVPSARAEVRYNPDPAAPAGPLTVSFPGVRTGRDVSQLAQEVFALPARLARLRKRKVVVALDEFQAVAGFNGGSVEHAIRAAVQQQRDVGYVFAGSEPSLMERMLTPKRPFYKAGPVMRLDKIPADEFTTFIDQRFARSGIKAEAGLSAAIVELAGNLPYDVQRLAHETWDEVRSASRRRATVDDLHAALTKLLAEQHVMFEAIWQGITLAQRAVLRAVVLDEGRELLSADVRHRHRLGGPSSVQASLGALIRDAIISREGSRYVVVDSLFREWVARRTF
jgi:AAA+ ATPase superfamily predicted ATPase